jgi:hypothetical protein
LRTYSTTSPASASVRAVPGGREQLEAESGERLGDRDRYALVFVAHREERDAARG